MGVKQKCAYLPGMHPEDSNCNIFRNVNAQFSTWLISETKRCSLTFSCQFSFTLTMQLIYEIVKCPSDCMLPSIESHYYYFMLLVPNTASQAIVAPPSHDKGDSGSGSSVDNNMVKDQSLPTPNFQQPSILERPFLK